MKIVSTETMRELERRTIADYGVPGETLMDRAGYGVARFVDDVFRTRDFASRAVLLVAGRGNNGGDIFAAARHLRGMKYAVHVWLAGSLHEVRGEALAHLGMLKAKRIRVEELPTLGDWEHELGRLQPEEASSTPVVVDGVLGTGLRGPARGPASGAIRYLNAHSPHSLVVAVDIPSGLDSDTGRAEGDGVLADFTLTMGLPKRGLVEPRAADHVGRLEVVPIGIPPELIEKAESDMDLITPADVAPLFARRPRSAHKGQGGHLLLVAGAAGYTGAAILAARAALRSGVGLVTVLAPRGVASVVAGSVPEAMVHAAPETDTGSLAAGAWPAWRSRLDAFTALAAGPGLTRHPDTASFLEAVLRESAIPVLLDADALNAFQGRIDVLAGHAGPLVITPHPGELARLLAGSVADVQARRFEVAREAARRARAVAVLKGAGTLVAESGRLLAVNMMTGNPGMAVGGMGDVLTGLLGGLLARGLAPYDAARAAVFLHGRAGDIAAGDKSESSLTAGDLVIELPYSLQDIVPR